MEEKNSELEEFVKINGLHRIPKPQVLYAYKEWINSKRTI